MKKTMEIILWLISIRFFLIHAHDTCCLTDKSDEDKFNVQRLSDFDRLEELNFDCNETVNISFIKFKPNHKIIYNNSLNIRSLTIRPLKPDIFSLMLDNFKGFVIESNPFEKVNFIDFKLNQTLLYIENSNFDFYFKDIIMDHICNETKILESLKPVNILSQSIVVVLSDSTLFSHNTCPFIFKNAYIMLLNIRVSSSFIFRNELKFQRISNQIRLNILVYQLDLTLYHSSLSMDLYNEHVFKSTAILNIVGQTRFIQHDLFKNFNQLKLLRIKMQSIREIFSRNNKWLEYLNYAVPEVDLKLDHPFSMSRMFILSIYQTYPNLTFYDFPIEDFCLFENFPHKRLVLPHIKRSTKSSCSCTEIFLIQFSQKYANEIDYYTGIQSNLINNYYQIQYYTFDLSENSIFSICLNSSLNQVIRNCQFSNKLNLCSMIRSSASSSTIKKNDSNSYFYMNDWQMLSKYGKYYESVYLSPLFCILTIVVNAFLFYILSNKTVFKQNQKIYQYLKINSFLNISFIAIVSLRLITICEDEDLFCLADNDSIYVRYYNIIFIKLIGNSLQTASNIAHVSFTLSRYIAITQTQSKPLKIFDKISMKKYALFMLAFSLILNAYICFEFNYGYDALYKEYHKQNFNVYKENYSELELMILKILQYTKTLISDIAYVIVSFSIDIVLVSFVRKKVSIKKSLTFVNPIAFVAFGQNKNAKEISKKMSSNTSNRRITGMIVFNGINFLLFKLPYSLISFYGLVFSYDYDSPNGKSFFKPNVASYMICRAFYFCDTLEYFFFLVYLNSFVVQFFILFIFDKNFRESYKQFKSSVKKRFC